MWPEECYLFSWIKCDFKVNQKEERQAGGKVKSIEGGKYIRAYSNKYVVFMMKVPTLHNNLIFKRGGIPSSVKKL